MSERSFPIWRLTSVNSGRRDFLALTAMKETIKWRVRTVVRPAVSG
jgi:hypothetical protein